MAQIGVLCIYNIRNYIMESYNYDPNTGIFTWATDSGRWGRIKKGTVAGHTRKDGYIILKVNGKNKYAHVVVFDNEGGVPDGFEVDHIDRNPSNNRRNNLRIVSSLQNSHNTGAPSTNQTGVKGVHWNKATNSYRARFRNDGEFVHVGLFPLLEDAKAAVQLRRKELHGEYNCN